MSPERQGELEAERQFLLRSLADLEREHDAGDVDATDYETLRDGYTARAAAIIRALERGAQPTVTGPTRSWGRTIAWIALVVAIAATAGVLVARSFGERSSNDASPTGGTGDRSGTSALLADARAAMPSDPIHSIELFTEVLKVEPDNAEALTYRAWLEVSAVFNADNAELQRTIATRSEAAFRRAIEVDPTYPDPKCFLAIVRFVAFDDPAGAQPYAQECQASNPPQVVKAQVDRLVEVIDATLASPGSTLPPETNAPASSIP